MEGEEKLVVGRLCCLCRKVLVGGLGVSPKPDHAHVGYGEVAAVEVYCELNTFEFVCQTAFENSAERKVVSRVRHLS